MPKFFDASSRTAGPVSSRRATADMFGGGDGFVKAGAAVMAIGDTIKKNQFKKENAAINQANVDNQGFGSTLFRTAKGNTDANATNFTTGVLADYDLNMETKLASAPNDRVRSEMKIDFTRTRNALVEKANVFESMTRSKNEVKVFVGNGHGLRNVLFETPTDDQYDLTLDARTREVNNMTSLSARVKEELIRDEVRTLRFSQYAGQLEAAVTPKQVADILDDRPEGEMSADGFTQLGKAGKAKLSRFKTDARLKKAERRGEIVNAQASIRGLVERLKRGEIPDSDSMRHTERLVGQVNDPLTSEMLFNVTTVGKAINGWMRLPSGDLEGVVAELEQDVGDGGATQLESDKLAAARSVLSKTLTGERSEQVATDTLVRDAFGRITERLKAGVDLRQDADALTVLASLSHASPRLQEHIRQAFAMNETVQGLADLSTAELMEVVRDAEENAALSDLNTVTRDAAKKVLDDMVKTTNKNYVDYQQRTLDREFPPLVQRDGESMRARQELMWNGAAKYGKSPQFHTTAEIADIGARLPDMPSDEQLEFIRGYTANMTRESAVIALSELGEDSPQVAFVGAGIASDPSYMVTGAMILRGQQKLTNEGDGLIKSNSAYARSDVESLMRLVLKDALNNENLSPHHKAAVQSAALSLIASGATRSPKDAINMVLGGSEGLGGIQIFNGRSFAAPVGVRSGMIDEALDNYPDSLTRLSVDGSSPVTANGAAVSAKAIMNDGTLERVGPDMFHVRMESDKGYLQGAPGTLYTLHITEDKLKELGVTR